MSEPTPSRPNSFADRYRLYIDESGDHVHRETDEAAHRFLCLLGCWFQNPAYLAFHESLEDLKRKMLRHHPDSPVVLHREDILHARRAFAPLKDDGVRKEWDEGLLTLIAAADFRVVAVVVDKKRLLEQYDDAAAHPYHLGLDFMLQRYAGYLNHVNRVGDVMAEARGGAEDRLLKESYERVWRQGAWSFKAAALQSALTSRQLKLEVKRANISGLQLADLLGHPIKQWVLRQHGLLDGEAPPFASRVIDMVLPKFNRHLYQGSIEGYGVVFFPKK